MSKEIVILFVFVLFFSTGGFSHDARIIWDKSCDQEVVGYNVYRSNENGVFALENKIGIIEVTDQNVVEYEYPDTDLIFGTVYYYVITSFWQDGTESDYSDEIAVCPGEYGDVDKNGEVGLMDAFMVLKFYDQSLIPDLQQEYSGDFDHDGEITPMDALAIMENYVLNQQENPPN